MESFPQSDLERICEALVTPVIFDGRILYERTDGEASGLEYYGIGRRRSVTAVVTRPRTS